MDDAIPLANSAAKRCSEHARTLSDQRRRARELLTAQRSQLETLETTLDQQIEQIACQLAERTGQSDPRLEEFERRAAELTGQADEVARLTDELVTREAELYEFEKQLQAKEQSLTEHFQQRQLETEAAEQAWAEREQQLIGREHTVAAATEELALKQTELTLSWERLQTDRRQLDADVEKLAQEESLARIASEELASEKQHMERARERLEAERKHLDAQRDRLEAEQAETKAQRRRIAHEFQAQRTERLAEFDRKRSQLTSSSTSGEAELQQELAVGQRENQSLRQQTAQLHKVLNARAEELTQLRSQLGELSSECATLRAQHDSLSQQLAIDGASDSNETAALAELRQEREILIQRLLKAEAIVSRGALSPTDKSELQQIQRRFELAVDDVASLKRRNADLESRLTQGGGTAALALPGQALDWEAQKRMFLASLSDEDDARDDDARDDKERDDDASERRLSIEGTIHITDEIVAQKDREIHELKQLLGEQSSNLGALASSASAVAEILDADELVRQEREKLASLQQAWLDKLRQAEVDISLERAKNAREAAAIDEKRLSYQSDMARNCVDEVDQPGLIKSGKPTRGRWLARLGLKDKDLEE